MDQDKYNIEQRAIVVDEVNLYYSYLRNYLKNSTRYRGISISEEARIK